MKCELPEIAGLGHLKKRCTGRAVTQAEPQSCGRVPACQRCFDALDDLESKASQAHYEDCKDVDYGTAKLRSPRRR